MPEILEIEIPDFVNDLLEPISSNSPVGSDVGNDPDFFQIKHGNSKSYPRL